MFTGTFQPGHGAFGRAHPLGNRVLCQAGSSTSLDHLAGQLILKLQSRRLKVQKDEPLCMH